MTQRVNTHKTFVFWAKKRIEESLVSNSSLVSCLPEASGARLSLIEVSQKVYVFDKRNTSPIKSCLGLIGPGRYQRDLLAGARLSESRARAPGDGAPSRVSIRGPTWPTRRAAASRSRPAAQNLLFVFTLSHTFSHFLWTVSDFLKFSLTFSDFTWTSSNLLEPPRTFKNIEKHMET